MHVTLEAVGHRYPGGPWLFQGVNARFDAGYSYAITAPSGAGKSTLLALVAGWRAAAEGTIVREGIRKINWVFQNPYGMPRRSALDHVASPFLAAGLRRGQAQCEALELCARFGIAYLADRPFRSLSGGEAQRLMLARAVAARPELLLVDEPTAQLDTASSRRVSAAIGALCESGRIVLVATHDADTIASCDRRLDLTEYASDVDDGRGDS